MAENPKKVRLQIEITTQADELLRAHNRHKGDMSRIINDLILKEFMPAEDKATHQAS